MQEHEPVRQTQFRTVHRMLQHLHIRRFSLLPSSLFLCMLNSLPSNITVEQYSPTHTKHALRLTCARTQRIVVPLKLQKGRKALLWRWRRMTEI